MTDLDILLTQDFLQKFKNVAVYKIANNHYELFDRYSITLVNDSVLLRRHSDDSERIFVSSQSAIAWATLDKLDRVIDADTVQKLDHQLGGILFELQLQKNLSKSSDRDISETKISELKFKLVKISSQLVEYVNRTRDWQFRQFAKKV